MTVETLERNYPNSVAQIRANERAKVIDEVINHAYESESGFLTIRKGFLIDLKEKKNDKS